jgi:hypothetical protein
MEATVAKTAVERLAGRRLGRALLVAGITAVNSGMLVYRLLRSAEDRDRGGR